MARLLTKAFFDRHANIVARDLIGVDLAFDGVGGLVVETESYDPTDPASHSYGGRITPRNKVMFEGPGRAYVYRSYGIHWCLNFVCADAGAVLIRALEPLHGLDRMAARRGTDVTAKLCSGPGRLCQALAVSKKQDGVSLHAKPFELRAAGEVARVRKSKRIGITKAPDALRRFILAGSPFLSRRD